MNSSTLNLTPYHINLRFFDTVASIKADSPVFTNIFTQMYPRFQVVKAVDSDCSPVEYVILSKPDNPWGKPVIMVDGQVRSLHNPRFLEGYTYETILFDIISRVRSHFLIHAGVVTYNDQAVVIVADSMHGKTTTVLELVRRGFRFLSDEMAALSRSDRQVHPFPRSLRIRPGTLERVGFGRAAQQAPVWLNKLILDIETIKPESMGQNAAISHIVILQDPAKTGPEQQESNRVLSIYVDYLNDELLTAIKRIEGVSQVRADVIADYPLVTLQTNQRFSAMSQIEAICQEHEALILSVIWGKKSAPTFDKPARLETIPKSQAVMSLMQQFLARYKSTILQNEFNGNSTHLFMELATLIGRAKCHKLSVGPLNQTADLICDLFDR